MPDPAPSNPEPHSRTSHLAKSKADSLTPALSLALSHFQKKQLRLMSITASPEIQTSLSVTQGMVKLGHISHLLIKGDLLLLVFQLTTSSNK